MIITDILFICIAEQHGLIDNNLDSIHEDNISTKIKKNLRNHSGIDMITIQSEKIIFKYYLLIKDWCDKFSELELKVPVDALEILVEDSWEKDNNTVNASKSNSSKKRRERGSYYTNKDLVSLIVNSTIDPLCKNKTTEEILSLKIIDPAVGTGKFLRETLHKLLNNLIKNYNELSEVDYSTLKRNIILNCLHGVDISATAIHATTYIFWIEANDRNLDIKKLDKNFVEGDSLLSSFFELKKPDLQDSKKMVLLELTNYYIVGRLIKGEKNIKFKDAYKEILEICGDNIDENEYLKIGKKTKSFIWNQKFPQVFMFNNGFDAVVGNPPWNKIKAHIKEFFEHYDNNIKSLQGDTLKKYIEEKFLCNNHYKELWEEHILHQKQYSQAINNSDYYLYQSYTIDGKKVSGDRDLYKYFTELSYKLVKDNGYVGLIIPASIIQAEGATGLRTLLFDNTNIEFIMTIENRDKIFPIDGRFKYSIIIFKKSQIIQNNIKCGFMLRNLGEAIECLKDNKFIVISKELINKTSPNNRSIPEIRLQAEVEMINKIYSRHPIINSLNGWKIEFFRELDMTNDSKLFVHRDLAKFGIDYLPLYEGRMVQQFDYGAKKYNNGEGRKAIWDNLSWGNKGIFPHFFVEKNNLINKNIRYDKARACYCDIAGQTNERAVQTTIIPPNVVAGNKVPTIKVYPDNIANNLLWVALTNSFVFDWIMRQKITTTINFFHWNQVPLPLIDLNSYEAKILIINSARLCLINEPMKQVKNELIYFYKGDIEECSLEDCKDQRERQFLRAEIDAVVAKIYDLDIKELAYIINQFTLVDRSQPSINNMQEKSSTITRDLILLKYIEKYCDNMDYSIVDVLDSDNYNIDDKDMCRVSIRERVSRAIEAGAVAYING